MELEPTVEVDKLGTRVWRVNGLRHRTDGPAVEWADGDREWWVNGELHRTDGPAVEYATENYIWFLNGREYTFQEWIALTTVDEHTRLLLMLKYSSC